VGQYAGIGFTEILKGKIACVSCWNRVSRCANTISHPDGVDVRFLQGITDQYGTVNNDKAKARGYKIEDGTEWLKMDADILIPSALEGQITRDTVGMISDRVKIIAEGANGPTTPEADEVIKKRGIFMIPDFLCNSGGVTVSYFEGVQNDMNFYWTREEVLEKLDDKMTVAFRNVVNMAEIQGAYMRDAAYMVGIASVVKAMQLRGWV